MRNRVAVYISPGRHTRHRERLIKERPHKHGRRKSEPSSLLLETSNDREKRAKAKKKDHKHKKHNNAEISSPRRLSQPHLRSQKHKKTPVIISLSL